MKKNAGFTLVELLIACIFIGIALFAIANVTGMIAKQNTSGTEQHKSFMGAETSMPILKSALSNASKVTYISDNEVDITYNDFVKNGEAVGYPANVKDGNGVQKTAKVTLSDRQLVIKLTEITRADGTNETLNTVLVKYPENANEEKSPFTTDMKLRDASDPKNNVLWEVYNGSDVPDDASMALLKDNPVATKGYFYIIRLPISFVGEELASSNKVEQVLSTYVLAKVKSNG